MFAVFSVFADFCFGNILFILSAVAYRYCGVDVSYGMGDENKKSGVDIKEYIKTIL